ncbi:hypothetical protein ADK47_14040 [Streptomyces rimosus subsp. rimosus]|nr:hypothetical protein ADK78_16300 [Kitasatospora aureofaciens]KOT39661.1 hypothetical protein ADK42_15275 [Streptomyces rimosus subsp. rimosus]QDA03004.1 hypothetical protein CTZ40_03830 [Streptomyces rimosus]KOT59274.1 hypothetical protein ADK45_22555 [Streptomyces rimosus subsp. rimosus]KOT80985.1 hypothetical protein ADK47_14040 [Streptomyces rimosus subsp. rimosus]
MQRLRELLISGWLWGGPPEVVRVTTQRRGGVPERSGRWQISRVSQRVSPWSAPLPVRSAAGPNGAMAMMPVAPVSCPMTAFPPDDGAVSAAILQCLAYAVRQGVFGCRVRGGDQ